MAGLSCGKIVIVIQTMTLTYKLYIQNEYRVGTPALQLKIRPYYKICRKLYSGSLEIWDSNVRSPYAFRDLSWYSYENEKSVKEKVCFVVQQGLGGLAVFYYDEDDPINICGDGQYPLTAIVVAAMNSQYHPPSVITDSQIYHYDSPSLTPLSQLDYHQYSEVNSKDPLVVYVEEENPYGKTVLPSKPSTGTYFPSSNVQHKSGPLNYSMNKTSLTREMNDQFSTDGFEAFYGATDSGSDEYHEDFMDTIYGLMEIGQSVDMAPPQLSTSNTPSMVFSEPNPVSPTVQLFSENVPVDNSRACKLFSEVCLRTMSSTSLETMML